VDTFSAKVVDSGASTTVSNENSNFINGDCTNPSTGTYVCTFVTGLFSVTPNCVAAVDDPRTIRVTSASNTSVTIVTYNSTTSVVSDANGFNLVCQKQGADFVATRNIIGSFAGIPTTIGSNGADIQSVRFGAGGTCSTVCSTGTCTICSQTGNKITSVTWSAIGTYRLNGIDGTKYGCVVNGYGAAGTILLGLQVAATQNSSYANIVMQTGVVATDSQGNRAICIGVP
jgi:hypothetical protein